MLSQRFSCNISIKIPEQRFVEIDAYLWVVTEESLRQRLTAEPQYEKIRCNARFQHDNTCQTATESSNVAWSPSSYIIFNQSMIANDWNLVEKIVRLLQGTYSLSPPLKSCPIYINFGYIIIFARNPSLW